MTLPPISYFIDKLFFNPLLWLLGFKKSIKKFRIVKNCKKFSEKSGQTELTEQVAGGRL